MKNPATRIKEALGELLQYNDRTRGGVPGEMYLGNDIFVVTVKRPRVIEGEWEDVDWTVDMMELIRLHQEGK